MKGGKPQILKAAHNGHASGVGGLFLWAKPA